MDGTDIKKKIEQLRFQMAIPAFQVYDLMEKTSPEICLKLLGQMKDVDDKISKPAAFRQMARNAVIAWKQDAKTNESDKEFKRMVEESKRAHAAGFDAKDITEVHDAMMKAWKSGDTLHIRHGNKRADRDYMTDMEWAQFWGFRGLWTQFDQSATLALLESDHAKGDINDKVYHAVIAARGEGNLFDGAYTKGEGNGT